MIERNLQNVTIRKYGTAFLEAFGMLPLTYFGAIGDNLTDNYANIQVAIDESIKRGLRYIFVPNGTYYYKSYPRPATERRRYRQRVRQSQNRQPSRFDFRLLPSKGLSRRAFPNASALSKGNSGKKFRVRLSKFRAGSSFFSAEPFERESLEEVSSYRDPRPQASALIFLSPSRSAYCQRLPDSSEQRIPLKEQSQYKS